MAIGVPGWPELAACTASMARVRMVLTAVCSILVADAIWTVTACSSPTRGVERMAGSSSKGKGTTSSKKTRGGRRLVCGTDGRRWYAKDDLFQKGGHRKGKRDVTDERKIFATAITRIFARLAAIFTNPSHGKEGPAKALPRSAAE